MNTNIYIIAVSFAAITLLVGGWGEFPMKDVGGPTGSAPSNVAQLPAKAKSTGTGKPFSYQVPVYKPPKGIGKPGGRVGGGTRGDESVTLFALVPDHLGLTINPQPTLYWYLSEPAPYPLILTVNEDTRAKPILETILGAPPKAGIYSVPLKAFDITLEMDTEYQWFVSLTMDPNSQSKDIVAGGMIKRIVPSEELRQKLKNARPEQVTAIYSEEGLWYDALASISNLCETSPKANHYCVGRRELLEQVDLSLGIMEIAKAEEAILVPQGTLSPPSPAP
ncbi:MAG: DUF928 domain-containing protein [Nitrospirota bacterium]|nr:MAG: DUF928 domain-containing protein [Nitrospirota bacterium]